MKVKSESEDAQLCLNLSDPMDCSLPGSSVYGIFQARVLEWGAIAFSEKAMYSITKLYWAWSKWNLIFLTLKKGNKDVVILAENWLILVPNTTNLRKHDVSLVFLSRHFLAILKSHYRALSWAPCAIQHLPISCVFHILWCMFQCYYSFDPSHPLLPRVCKSVLYICVSIPVLQIGSLVPVFLDSIYVH